MKAKLLKKLRNNAKKCYWIEDHKGQVGRYWVRNSKCRTGYYLHSFASLVDAVRYLKAKRRSFVLEALEYEKEKRGKNRLSI